MKNTYLTAFALSALSLVGCHSTKKLSNANSDGFTQIFNGRTLDNWVGDSTYWSVQDNCLVGTITPETIVKRNTFIIYQGTMPDDFELILEYQVSDKGNSDQVPFDDFCGMVEEWIKAKGQFKAK